MVSRLLKACGCRHVSKFGPSVTHVLCRVDKEGNARRRTLKLMLGILKGKWIVSMDWVSACLERGGPASEEDFEVKGDCTGQRGGPMLGRLQAGLDLLRGWEIFLYGEFAHRKKDLEELVLATGARLLTRLPPAVDTLQALHNCENTGLQIDSRTAVVVASEGKFRRPTGWEGVCVAVSWLKDTSSTFTVQPLVQYLAEPEVGK